MHPIDSKDRLYMPVRDHLLGCVIRHMSQEDDVKKALAFAAEEHILYKHEREFQDTMKHLRRVQEASAEMSDDVRRLREERENLFGLPLVGAGFKANK